MKEKEKINNGVTEKKLTFTTRKNGKGCVELSHMKFTYDHMNFTCDYMNFNRDNISHVISQDGSLIFSYRTPPPQ